MFVGHYGGSEWKWDIWENGWKEAVEGSIDRLTGTGYFISNVWNLQHVTPRIGKVGRSKPR